MGMLSRKLLKIESFFPMFSKKEKEKGGKRIIRYYLGEVVQIGQVRSLQRDSRARSDRVSDGTSFALLPWKKISLASPWVKWAGSWSWLLVERVVHETGTGDPTLGVL